MLPACLAEPSQQYVWEQCQEPQTSSVVAAAAELAAVAAAAVVVAVLCASVSFPLQVHKVVLEYGYFIPMQFNFQMRTL